MYGSVVSVAPKCRRLERLTSVADQLARSPDQPKLPNLVGSNPPKSYQKQKLSPPRPKNTPYTSSRLPASLLHQNWNCLQFTARPNCRAVILPFFVMRREIFSAMAAKSQRASEVQWHFLEATDHCRKNPEGEDFGRKKQFLGEKYLPVKIPCEKNPGEKNIPEEIGRQWECVKGSWWKYSWWKNLWERILVEIFLKKDPAGNMGMTRALLLLSSISTNMVSAAKTSLSSSTSPSTSSSSLSRLEGHVFGIFPENDLFNFVSAKSFENWFHRNIIYLWLKCFQRHCWGI